MNTIRDFLETTLTFSDELLTNILLTLFWILVLVVVRLAAMRVVQQRARNIHDRYRWRKAIETSIGLLAVVITARIWLVQVGSLATYLGLLSAGIAVALSDTLVNLAGWFFIVWQRPFEVGDRIEIGSEAGDVVDIGFLQFTLVEIRKWVDADQSTGRLLHVPNRKVFQDAVANFTHGGFEFIWHEIPIVITFESNWIKAKERFTKIMNEQALPLVAEAEKGREAATKSGKIVVLYGKLTPRLYTSVHANGICLTMRLLSKPRHRRGVTEAIWEKVLHQLAEDKDIHLAYPTQRVYAEWLENPAAPPQQEPHDLN